MKTTIYEDLSVCGDNPRILDSYEYSEEELLMALVSADVLSNVHKQEYIFLRLLFKMRPEEGLLFFNHLAPVYQRAWNNLKKSEYPRQYPHLFRPYMPEVNSVLVDYTKFRNMATITRYIDKLAESEWQILKSEWSKPGVLKTLLSSCEEPFISVHNSRWVEVLSAISACDLKGAVEIFQQYPDLCERYDPFIEALEDIIENRDVSVCDLLSHLDDNVIQKKEKFLWYFHNKNFIHETPRLMNRLKTHKNHLGNEDIISAFYCADISQGNVRLNRNMVFYIEYLYNKGCIQERSLLDVFCYDCDITSEQRAKVDLLLGTPHIDSNENILHYQDFLKIRYLAEDIIASKMVYISHDECSVML